MDQEFLKSHLHYKYPLFSTLLQGDLVRLSVYSNFLHKLRHKLLVYECVFKKAAMVGNLLRTLQNMLQ